MKRLHQSIIHLYNLARQTLLGYNPLRPYLGGRGKPRPYLGEHRASGRLGTQHSALSTQHFFLLVLCLGLAACSTPPAAPTVAAIQPTITPSPVATRTPLILPSLTPTNTALPAVTPSATAVLVDSYTGIGYEPPFDITLPDGWTALYNTAVIPEMGELAPIPLAIYQGPVTGGKGTIALLWNFRSITTGNPLDPAAGQVNLWVDGLRYLRLLVVEIGCNVGTDDQRNDFMLAGQPATGTIWSAVDCPELPDTRGWFAGVQVYGMSFVFYAFGEPISVMDGAAVQEMQAILDSIRFRTADSQ